MPNIVAIGGGNLLAGETEPIDREIVRLAGKEGPRALSSCPRPATTMKNTPRPLARSTADWDAKVDVLRLWTDSEVPSAVERIRRADLVYVGGGNTKKMLARWRETGVERAMRAAAAEGKPLGGTSAGAICWAELANSDWPQYEGIEGVNTARLEGLGLLNLALSPHTSREPFRLDEFRAMMRDVPLVGVGIDDGCALQVRGDAYRVLASLPGAVAHRIEWQGEELSQQELPPHDEFRSLQELTRRRH